MKRPALQNKQVVVLRMAFRARKVLGTFEKRAPELKHGNESDRDIFQPHTGIYAIRNRSNFFFLFISNEIEENDGIMINYPNLNCH